MLFGTLYYFTLLFVSAAVVLLFSKRFIAYFGTCSLILLLMSLSGSLVAVVATAHKLVIYITIYGHEYMKQLVT